MTEFLSILLLTLILVVELALVLETYIADRDQKRDAARMVRRGRRRQSSIAAALGLQIRWISRVEASELGATGIGDRAEAYQDRRVPPVHPVTDMPIANLVGRGKRVQAFCQTIHAENAAPHGERYQAFALACHADLPTVPQLKAAAPR